MAENVSEGRDCCYFWSASCHISRNNCGRSARAGTLEREINSFVQTIGRKSFRTLLKITQGWQNYMSEDRDFRYFWSASCHISRTNCDKSVKMHRIQTNCGWSPRAGTLEREIFCADNGPIDYELSWQWRRCGSISVRRSRFSLLLKRMLRTNCHVNAKKGGIKRTKETPSLEPNKFVKKNWPISGWSFVLRTFSWISRSEIWPAKRVYIASIS